MGTGGTARLSRRGLLLAVIAVATLAAAPSAQAALPGKPGKIAFSLLDAAFDTDLFAVSPRVGDPLELTDTASIGETEPAYSPSGRLIAFTSYDGIGTQYEIFVMNANGRGTPRSLTEGEPSSNNPSFSRDGRLIVYERNDGPNPGIYVMNSDGSNPRRVANDGFLQDPAFSPNGRHIVFAGAEIFRARADGSGDPVPLTDGGAGFYEEEPAYSPDGRRIVWRRGTGNDSARAIWIMRPDGSGERALTPFDGYRAAPIVAPDSSRIGFIKEGPGGTNDLFTIPFGGGGGENPITSGLSIGYGPDWQPLPVRCGGRRATLVGTPGPDLLTGTAARDVIAGLGGRDRIRGKRGRDVLCGGAGRDKLVGGRGRDRCIGGPGGDRARRCEGTRSL